MRINIDLFPRGAHQSHKPQYGNGRRCRVRLGRAACIVAAHWPELGVTIRAGIPGSQRQRAQYRDRVRGRSSMTPAAESERGQAMGKPLGPWSALSANAWQRMPRFAPPVLDCDVVSIRLSAMLIALNVSAWHGSHQAAIRGIAENICSWRAFRRLTPSRPVAQSPRIRAFLRFLPSRLLVPLP